MKGYFLLVVLLMSLGAGSGQAGEKEANPCAYNLVSLRDTIARSWFNGNRRSYSRKGDFFLQAGFNWTGYGRSDINFDGPGYDFTLEDVRAKDEPYKMPFQYNIQGGYFITDKYSIALGFDHMKYIMKVPQQLTISGVIESQVSDPPIQTGQFAGDFDNQELMVTPDLLMLEYTDGFNYVNTRVHRYDDIWVADNGLNSLTLETAVGGGVIIPRADIKLFGVGMNNKFNVAGWAASLRAGLIFNFNEKLYLMGSLEAGYANMDKIYTTGRNAIDKASQKLNFLQNTYVIGIRF
jgi:hypothetical protein